MADDRSFYLGKLFDQKTGKVLDTKLEYDPADLTTHGIVTGMTGSGKTGLCIGLLEEAALQGIPAIIIDPKGDLTNLALHFPNLAPTDFMPWMNPDEVRKSGKSMEGAAGETAETWKTGLAGWGIGPERIAALKDAVQFTIYTPGSDTGIPVSILASLKAPNLTWAENREALLERISSTVTALLGLIGKTDIDPVRSKEHILLSNIFQNSWSQGKDLDLSELILQTQSPPLQKLGVFPLDQFYPPADRMELAMLLNNFLASPAFAVWLDGEPLDIQSMLWTREGKPRHSIFTISHLGETERMFFITLLYSAVETWMRAQTGSTTLRALIYFDEIMGYLPPLGNPPSKTVILRMLKQARAFGVGLLLATQNPVDVDYKALSNAGTWFIGKLQTDQDKQRLLDGLEGLAGGIDRAGFDRIISALGKRVFLLHNVHEKAPVVMQTRWAMNYLAGPLTRVQIPALNKLLQVEKSALPNQSPRGAGKPQEISTNPTAYSTKPALPAKVDEFYLPIKVSLAEALKKAGTAAAEGGKSGILYRPALIGQAQIRYLDRRYNLDAEVQRMVILDPSQLKGLEHWEDGIREAINPREIQTAAEGARYSALEGDLADGKAISTLRTSFENWLYQTGDLRIKANIALKEYAKPDSTNSDFRQQCAEAARDARDTELAKAAAAIDKQIKALEIKIEKESSELAADKQKLTGRTVEEVGAGLETVLGFLGGRKRGISKNLTKRRMTAEAKGNVAESERMIERYKDDLAELTKQKTALSTEINDRWAKIVDDVTEVVVLPSKSNIFVELFGIAWVPYHIIDGKEGEQVLPAF